MSSASESASLAAASEDQLLALAVQLKRSQRELEAAQQAKDAERLHRLEALQVALQGGTGCDLLRVALAAEGLLSVC